MVEILIVISFLALLTMFIYPNINRMLDRNEIENQTKQFINFFRNVRLEAIQSSETKIILSGEYDGTLIKGKSIELPKSYSFYANGRCDNIEFILGTKKYYSKIRIRGDLGFAYSYHIFPKDIK